MQREKKQQAEKLENEIMSSILTLEKQFDMNEDNGDFIFAISLGIHFGFGRSGTRVVVYYSHAFRGTQSKIVKTADEAMEFFKENGIE